MWQAIKIGWNKSKEAQTNWDDAKIKAANFNSRALMLYSMQSLIRSSRRYPLLKLLRRHGPFSRQPIRELRLSRIRSFRGSP